MQDTLKLSIVGKLIGGMKIYIQDLKKLYGARITNHF